MFRGLWSAFKYVAGENDEATWGRYLVRAATKEAVKSIGNDFFENFTSVTTYTESTSVKISGHKDESTTVVEATKTIQRTHQIRDISNSDVLQGDVNVNNFNIHFHIHGAELRQVEEIDSEFANFLRELQVISANLQGEIGYNAQENEYQKELLVLKNRVQRIDTESNEQISQLMHILSNTTDYPKLKMALTNQ